MIYPKNWQSFQHYKQRNPPWIKLHRSLLDDPIFQCLPIASRALAPMLWLQASMEIDGGISFTTEQLAFRFRMGHDEFLSALKPLVDNGFFVAASEMLASCKQSAMPETETEAKKETKTKDKKPVREVTISHLKEESREAFDSIWHSWPIRSDGSYSKGSRGKAEKCFQAIVDAGEATPKELVECVEIYRTHPNVQKGFVQMVATFFSLDAGTWVECLDVYRDHMEAK